MADSYKGEDAMNLDDVAYLFVEQYENLHGLYTEEYRKPEVDLRLFSQQITRVQKGSEQVVDAASSKKCSGSVSWGCVHLFSSISIKDIKLKLDLEPWNIPPHSPFHGKNAPSPRVVG